MLDPLSSFNPSNRTQEANQGQSPKQTPNLKIHRHRSDLDSIHAAAVNLSLEEKASKLLRSVGAIDQDGKAKEIHQIVTELIPSEDPTTIEARILTEFATGKIKDFSQVEDFGRQAISDLYDSWFNRK